MSSPSILSGYGRGAFQFVTAEDVLNASGTGATSA